MSFKCDEATLLDYQTSLKPLNANVKISLLLLLKRNKSFSCSAIVVFTSLYVALTKNFSQSKIECEAALDDIWEVIEELQKITYNKPEHCSALIQIHACAVSLWNLAVGMKTDGSGTLTTNARCRSTHLVKYVNGITGCSVLLQNGDINSAWWSTSNGISISYEYIIAWTLVML